MNLHDIEHVVFHTVNLAVPGLMEMTVVPLINGMVVFLQEGQNLIHRPPFLLDVL